MRIEKNKDKERVVITVRPPNKGGKTKSITVYDTTVEEIFNFILKEIGKQNIGGNSSVRGNIHTTKKEEKTIPTSV